MITFELLVKLPDDKVSRHVLCNGGDGVNAARNYVAEHPGATVFAFRKPVAPLTVLGHAGRIEG